MPTPSQKQAVTPQAGIEINSIHSFLIRPGKGSESPDDINGATVAKSGRLFEMLKPIFDGAEKDCPHKLTSDQNRRLAFTAAQAWGADQIFDEMFRQIT